LARGVLAAMDMTPSRVYSPEIRVSQHSEDIGGRSIEVGTAGYRQLPLDRAVMLRANDWE
jgi:hypothetical protein